MSPFLSVFTSFLCIKNGENIDPPYNTGNEKWVYNDNVNDPRIRRWLGEVVGPEGEDLSRHDKWLCMMYPRLKLLQRLLSDDGVIFISISDTELYHLKICCDEIFGSNNFVEEFIWHIDGHTDKQEKITHIHEYIVCYAKRKTMLSFNSVVAPHVANTSKIFNDFAENSITKNGFKNPPSVIELPMNFPCEIQSLYKEKHPAVEECMDEVQQTGYISREMTKKYALSYPARIDDMIVENFALAQPCRVYSGWMNNGKLKKFIANGCKPIDDSGTTLRFYLSKNGVVYYRREGRQNHYIPSVLEKMGTTETNKYMLESMGIQFEFPKPVSLIEFLLSMFSEKDSVVLDSFAGSGTTAHAVLNLNKSDGGNRKFILIEMMDYAESITAERVRRVISGYGEGKKAVEGTGGGFGFYELGEPLLNGDKLNEDAGTEKIREYVWYTETRTRIPPPNPEEPYLLGVHAGTAVYFYYERDGVTTLDREFLRGIRTKAEKFLIYADVCILGKAELEARKIRFKKIPRDISKIS